VDAFIFHQRNLSFLLIDKYLIELSLNMTIP